MIIKGHCRHPSNGYTLHPLHGSYARNLGNRPDGAHCMFRWLRKMLQSCPYYGHAVIASKPPRKEVGDEEVLDTGVVT